jgi:ABC-type glycerol-3-phosphate transport system permease component
MFCQYCGNQMTEGAKFCGVCGRPSAAGAVVATTPDPMQGLKTHLKILGILWAVYGAFRIVMAAWTLVFSHFMLPMFVQFISQEDGRSLFPLFHFLHVFYVVIAIYSVVTGILGILAAWALMRHEPWGRTLALVAGFVSLINIPYGTAIGVYTIIILLPPSALQTYDRIVAAP